jgi:hypothetical protein
VKLYLLNRQAVATQNIRKTQIRELLLDSLHKLLANLVLKIKFLIIIALLNRSIPANRAHIDHAIAELDKSPALHRNIQIGHIMQNEPDKLLVILLANPLDETVRRERHTHADRRQAVLSKAEVEEGGDGDAGGAELFLLLGEVGAADEADGDFVAQGGEELQHLGRDGLEERGEATLAGGLFLVLYGMAEAALTRRAGVRVPSTSKRQIVFLTGRSVSEGMTLAAGAVVAMVG